MLPVSLRGGSGAVPGGLLLPGPLPGELHLVGCLGAMTGTAAGRGERSPGGLPKMASRARARGSGAAMLSGFPFLFPFPSGFNPPLADVTTATLPSPRGPQPRGTWLPPRPPQCPRNGEPLAGRGREGRGEVPRLLLVRVKLRCRCPASHTRVKILKTMLRVEGGSSPTPPTPKGKKRASETFLQPQAARETNGLFGSFLVLDVGVQLQFYFLKPALIYLVS